MQLGIANVWFREFVVELQSMCQGIFCRHNYSCNLQVVLVLVVMLNDKLIGAVIILFYYGYQTWI